MAAAQDAAEAALQRLGNFRQVREREPDLSAAGDHDAVGVRAGRKPASVTFWRRDDIRRHARAERDVGGVCGCGGCARFRPAAAARLWFTSSSSARSADNGSPAGF